MSASTSLEFQPCPICHLPLGPDRRVAGVAPSGANLVVHYPGSCWQRREELRATYGPGTVVVGALVRPFAAQELA